MKKNYFWSPHIDPQVATVKSVFNSLNSLSKFEKNPLSLYERIELISTNRTKVFSK